MTQASSLALSGLQVLDLSRLLPGPMCSHILVGYGAEVLKVEDTGAGDYARRNLPLVLDQYGATFTATNAGKRSIAVDLKTDAGKAILRQLIAGADVLIESFRPGVMARLGFDPQDLLAQHPRLIYCAISGYGQSGAEAKLAGHDLNYQAAAGLVSQRLAEDRAVPSTLLADLVGGAQGAAMSILAAILQRQATGQGQFIDISLAHGCLSLVAHTGAAEFNGDVGVPFGQSRLTGGNPSYGVFEAADGRLVALGALEAKFWTVFCQEADLSDLAELNTNGDADTRAMIHGRLQTLFKTKTAAEWHALGEQWDVCLNQVNTLSEARDWALEREDALFHHYTQADTGRDVRVLAGVTANLAQQGRQLTPPPKQGQHTAEVLAQLGYDDAARAKLLAAGVVMSAGA
jgi:crotonobetainyl-CoA:carnitine CoA-transferase CaiB-like acyl-CoA transferase